MFRLAVFLVTILVAAISAASIPVENSAAFPFLDGRIVGGDEADISKHPHQISLRWRKCDTCPFLHRCGGSIINSKMILTAAHCVVNIAANKLYVVAASNERNGPGVIVPVAKVISHEEYNAEGYENDIALLVLGADLPLNQFNIKAIELANEQPSGGEQSTVTGWGTTTEGGTPSDYLMEVDVNIIAQDDCEASYGSEGLISDSMLCAGTPNGGRDACQGDSGGPLLVNGLLTGIVSWGYGCANAKFPGVYTNVPNLRGWIDNAISSNL